MSRPKVALLATTYFGVSHADVLGTRLIEGYAWGGAKVQPRIEVVAMYIEQNGAMAGAEHRPDIGAEIARRNAIPVFSTIAEAIGVGRPGVNVDGVIIIAEHGDYELNQYGQKLYPRRRYLDSALSAMLAAGRAVPIFCDKHLAWNFSDARSIYDASRRLGIPLLAGSTVPLTWRIPTATEWPLGEPMTKAVAVGYGPTEAYGFHILEGLQVHAERRAGGETGVRSVRALSGDAAAQAVANGTVDRDLLTAALYTLGLDEAACEDAMLSTDVVFLVEYVDGLRAAAVNCAQGVRNFATACSGLNRTVACQTWLQGKPWSHFIFLARQIESMVLSGSAPYPVERTLLTTGILDAAMHSLHDDCVELATPDLGISYPASETVPDTGVLLAAPTPEASSHEGEFVIVD